MVAVVLAVWVAPSSSVTSSDTVNVPSSPYGRTGFWSTDELPSPNVQVQATTVPSLSVEASMKLTSLPSGAE